MSRIRFKRKDEHFSNRLKEVGMFAEVLLNYHYQNSKLHCDHVRGFAKLLCLQYNKLFPEKAISQRDQQLMYEAAALHDIGMIAIPSNLITKGNGLTEEEKKLFYSHTTVGEQVIREMAEICGLTKYECDQMANVCRYHHERYDGKGYPDGLAGEAIPFTAQIVSVAEVYDSLTRANYSKARSHKEAVELITSGSCGAFNPDLMLCLENAASDMQTLLECQDNNKRTVLLQNMYGSSRRAYWLRKRAMDLVVSGCAVVVLSPVFLLLSLIIWLDDPHASPIFCQNRVGRHNKIFKMYKFRTMYKDAEERKKALEAMNEKDGPVFKIANDPRITRVGKFLRKTSIDELPQLFNVLKGDMTLVGPRPPLPEEVEQYNRFTQMRLRVTPGLTCIWQIQPERDNVSFDDWMNMDIDYIGTRSLKGDLKILLKTVRSVFAKSGS